MVTLEEIYSFLQKTCSVPVDKISPSSDLADDLGIDGDDFFELEEEFANQFNVDMSSYRWYFHHGEEGFFGLGGIFFPAPQDRVKNIPVTPQLLLEAANKKVWPVIYPEHKLPDKRYDILINQLSIVVFLFLLGVIAFYKIFA